MNKGVVSDGARVKGPPGVPLIPLLPTRDEPAPGPANRLYQLLLKFLCSAITYVPETGVPVPVPSTGVPRGWFRMDHLLAPLIPEI